MGMHPGFVLRTRLEPPSHPLHPSPPPLSLSLFPPKYTHISSNPKYMNGPTQFHLRERVGCVHHPDGEVHHLAEIVRGRQHRDPHADTAVAVDDVRRPSISPETA